MAKKSKVNLPYTFETKLNCVGNTVVYLKKGDKKVWLFNISDGIIEFDIGHSEKELKNVGLLVDSQGMPEITGYYTIQEVKRQLNRIEDILVRVFNIDGDVREDL